MNIINMNGYWLTINFRLKNIAKEFQLVSAEQGRDVMTVSLIGTIIIHDKLVEKTDPEKECTEVHNEDEVFLGTFSSMNNVIESIVSDNPDQQPIAEINFKSYIFFKEDDVTPALDGASNILEDIFKQDTNSLREEIRKTLDELTDIIDESIERQAGEWNWSYGDFYSDNNLAGVALIINEELADKGLL